LRFGPTCPQFLGDSGGEFNYSQAEDKQPAARSLRLGVISATLSDAEYSSSLLDNSYGLKAD